MGSNMTIRFADTEDINLIGYLAQQVWPATYGKILSPEQIDYMMELFYHPSSLSRQMMEEQHFFIIVEEGEEAEEPLGFASYSETASPGIYKLHKIYVMPSSQGKGVGKHMIDFVVGHIRPKGARALRLNVNRYNRARSFYEKLGFSVIGEEDIDIGNNYFMNDYIMEMRID